MIPLGTLAASNPEPLSKALMLATSTALRFIPRIGKSQDQKEAEYWLSDQTNKIEAAMDINRLAFWTGLIPIEAALDNYGFLWAHLENAARQVQSITPAQASRTISDRDYGGQFAHEWRGIFRDDLVAFVTSNPALIQNGYVIPSAQWDWPEKARYMDIGSTIDLSTLPNPIPTEKPGEGILGTVAGLPGWVKWGGAGLLAWKFLL